MCIELQNFEFESISKLMTTVMQLKLLNELYLHILNGLEFVVVQDTNSFTYTVFNHNC
jgi:hypothetical protein